MSNTPNINFSKREEILEAVASLNCSTLVRFVYDKESGGIFAIEFSDATASVDEDGWLCFPVKLVGNIYPPKIAKKLGYDREAREVTCWYLESPDEIFFHDVSGLLLSTGVLEARKELFAKIVEKTEKEFYAD